MWSRGTAAAAPGARACTRELVRCITTASSPHSDALSPEKPFMLHKYQRYLSTLNSQQLPPATRGTDTFKDQSREFMDCFPEIVRELTETGKHLDAPDATKWIAKVLQYNVPGGKKTRGLATVLAYKMLERPENHTPENIRLANVMGWCIEMLQGFLVLDDIMDGSETRRGAPCWYRQEGVGLSAINDAMLIHAAMYSTLKRNFRDKPYYINVLEMFNEMNLKTSIGQHMDLSMTRADKPNLNQFTMDKYNAIAKYKTAYYTFQMPVSLAMLMAGIADPETHRQAKTVLLEMGQFYQIQNDFVDCFANPEVTGKVGTDIEEGKCTWLAVVALQRASPAQRLLMDEFYGSREPQHVAKIKLLYEELNLPHTYSVHKETSYNIIRAHIQQITRGIPHDLFFNLLEILYKRTYLLEMDIKMHFK